MLELYKFIFFILSLLKHFIRIHMHVLYINTLQMYVNVSRKRITKMANCYKGEQWNYPAPKAGVILNVLTKALFFPIHNFKWFENVGSSYGPSDYIFFHSFLVTYLIIKKAKIYLDITIKMLFVCRYHVSNFEAKIKKVRNS